MFFGGVTALCWVGGFVPSTLGRLCAGWFVVVGLIGVLRFLFMLPGFLQGGGSIYVFLIVFIGLGGGHRVFLAPVLPVGKPHLVVVAVQGAPVLRAHGMWVRRGGPHDCPLAPLGTPAGYPP